MTLNMSFSPASSADMKAAMAQVTATQAEQEYSAAVSEFHDEFPEICDSITRIVDARIKLSEAKQPKPPPVENGLNPVQRKVLIVAAWVVALMLLVPPYSAKNSYGVTLRSGYSFIFELPERTTLDAATLFAQVVGVVIVAALVVLARKE